MNRDNYSNSSPPPARLGSETDDKGDGRANTAEEDGSVFVFPATSAQRRFWLLDQLQPGGVPAFNMSLATRWHGPLDELALRRALNEVVARHEALRTTLEDDRGQLRQLIASSSSTT